MPHAARPLLVRTRALLVRSWSCDVPDYRTAHRRSSSELGELESEQRDIELRVASLSADSRGGRRRDCGPPQGKSIIACAIGLCICASTTRVLPSPRTLSPCRPVALRPSPLAARPSRPYLAPSAQVQRSALLALLAAAARDRGVAVGPVDPWEPANANAVAYGTGGSIPL